ncbi:uncharacterized protein LOC105202213 isoform X1 [Solenopsis invicta]|uniref:uncharacterized protein LOC105202213 isoform X1 n=1 Tax=Solenopsis invicta TaxID=13686 RepID=UPI000595B7B9|nr:uncharacterized protein LOC105202213 isoform X1 [Solenopsis invicta]XP_039312831.1 uncharacterized protein LOC105202213 isoform X1 [Solenopsis invicta]
MSAKRRRVSSRCRQNARRCKVAECTLDTLPPEIFSIILKMLPLHDVACTVRLVSRRCYDIAATVLNSEFLIAGTRLRIAMKRTEDLKKSVKTGMELLECNKIFNALELIWLQYRMLKAVTWRYTHSRSRDSPVSCFYGGRILDNLNYLLHSIFNSPCRGSCVFSYVDLQIFARTCENFMDHFEKVTERRLNDSALVSGCKLVDVLDCLEEGRQVLSFRTSSRTGNPMICMHLKYVLKRAWFTCLRVPNASNEYCWRDKQRYMYLRLRRLVGSYNKHLFHKLHYERKLILRTAPPAWTYSGYGEYGGQFFYYGNMSKYAYENRFRHARVRSAENTGRELEEATNRPPCFDVIIGVQLRCSPELAPLTAKMNLKTDTFEGCDTNSPQELYLKLNIKCAISKINRLPNTFTWEVHGRRKNRRKSLQCR